LGCNYLHVALDLWDVITLHVALDLWDVITLRVVLELHLVLQAKWKVAPKRKPKLAQKINERA
jgi:hypothetical protein